MKLITTALGLTNVVTQPVLLVTRKLTVKLPCVIYVCDGFCKVDVKPSPKFHRYDKVPVPDDVLVNTMVTGRLQPVTAVLVKAAVTPLLACI